MKGLLDFFDYNNSGLKEFSDNGLSGLRNTMANTPKMYDPHANARALMGGQPMQQPVQRAVQNVAEKPIDMYPTQITRPTGMLDEQVDTTIGPNMGQINSTAPRGMLSPQVDTTIGPNMNLNRPYNDSKFTPTDTMQSPYGSKPYPNQLGNPNEVKIPQLSGFQNMTLKNPSGPFSWIKDLLSPDTASKEDLIKNGVIPNPEVFTPPETVTNPTERVSMSPFDNPGMMEAIAMQESSNRHTDENGKMITSPAGAVGKYQIMPSTAAQPGFGLEPLDLATATEADHEEFSRNYLNKLNERFGNQPDLTLAAYNYGVGNVEKLLQEYGVRWKEYLPQETSNYLKNFNML